MEEEELPDYTVNKEIIEYNRKQIQKRAKRSVLRKITMESDSESIYTDSEEEDIEGNEDITVIAHTLGIMGINVRKQRRFMTSIKRTIAARSEEERKMIEENINWLKVFYDAVTHVKTINANLTKMIGKSNTSDLSDVLGTLANKPSSNKKKFNPKRKTVPCIWYHGEVGCHRSDNCDFIHDARYKGRKVPNMKNYVSILFSIYFLIFANYFFTYLCKGETDSPVIKKTRE